nr:putative wax ester synthase/acyl-CoA:diacylglycerol acyltransferase [uncultured bacterium]
MDFDEHMSDNEALMWNLEKDPALSSWFASITILDTVPSIDRLKTRMSAAVRTIPRLRQRVVPSLGRFSPPRWVDDGDFDLDFHVRRIAVPAPGTMEDLHEVAVKALLDPFERSRPLWQMLVIEGLEGGKAALFQKMHHTITDGEGGVRLAEQFVDLTRDAEDPELDTTPWPSPPAQNLIASTADMVGHNVRRAGGVAGRVVRSIVTNPAGTAGSVAAVLAELDKTLLRPPTAPGEVVGSPLWRPRTLRRWYGTLQLPFDDVKRAGKALGGTINDVFVAGALAGSGAYHEARGVHVDKLRVAMPVSTRTSGTAGGNSFSITTNALSAPSDPLEAFRVVREGLAKAKSGGSVDVLGSLSMIVNLLPTSLLTSVAKDSAASVDFTVSNVRGAPIELYIAGAKCEALYPMGPISGTGFNLSTLSYAGHLDMGMVVDSGAIDDPADLRDHLQAAYDVLLAQG